tara:strand:+ start:505 stop:723 length:219 start_codon:yes stop_codon:yes gene_type:complete
MAKKEYSLQRLLRTTITVPIKEVDNNIDYYETENPSEPHDDRVDMLCNLRSVLGSKLFKEWAGLSSVEIYDV